jgi:hypothetical protein
LRQLKARSIRIMCSEPIITYPLWS